MDRSVFVYGNQMVYNLVSGLGPGFLPRRGLLSQAPYTLSYLSSLGIMSGGR